MESHRRVAFRRDGRSCVVDGSTCDDVVVAADAVARELRPVDCAQCTPVDVAPALNHVRLCCCWAPHDRRRCSEIDGLAAGSIGFWPVVQRKWSSVAWTLNIGTAAEPAAADVVVVLCHCGLLVCVVHRPRDDALRVWTTPLAWISCTCVAVVASVGPGFLNVFRIVVFRDCGEWTEEVASGRQCMCCESTGAVVGRLWLSDDRLLSGQDSSTANGFAEQAIDGQK